MSLGTVTRRSFCLITTPRQQPRSQDGPDASKVQQPPASQAMSLSSEGEDPFLSDGEGGNENELPSDVEDDILDDDDDEDEDEDDPFNPAQQPPPHTQSQMLSFGPPYYGRPPTPLPPSPSLTSLLRPSRPTTPDASDDEGLNSAEPVPRASPRVPTYEYYGFVLYLFSSLLFLIYLLWSYLPSPFLHILGIYQYYYPNRWWSLAIPSYLVMLVVYIFVALALYNSEYLTLPLNNLETIVDDAGKIAVVDGRGRIVTSEERRRNLEREREREGLRGKKSHHQRKTSWNAHTFPRDREVDWRECWNEGTDAVMDVPLSGVCEILYGGSRGEDDSIFNAS